MQPTPIDTDVQVIVNHSMQVMEGLKEQLTQEGNGLRRVLARLYNMPVEDAAHLIIAGTKDGLWVFDDRTHTFDGGSVVELPWEQVNFTSDAGAE